MVLKSLTDRNSIARKIVTGASAGCVFRVEYDELHDHIGVPWGVTRQAGIRLPELDATISQLLFYVLDRLNVKVRSAFLVSCGGIGPISISRWVF